MADVQQQPGGAGAPSVIRIKRKRDDAPLDSLYLEGSKRRATDHTYIFKRLDQERGIEPIFRQEYFADGIPKIRTTTQGEETRDPYALGRVRDAATPTKQKQAKDATAGPRRFHLSRAMSVSAAKKGKTEVATFIERRWLAQSAGATGLQGTGAHEDNAEEQQRPLKRPTARARKAQTSGSGAATPPAMPATAEVDVSLAHKMDQWSQQEAQETELGAGAGVSGNVDAMEIDNEADYVYDTYYRHEAVTATDVPSTGISFGHLVIDEDQEDLWETYLDGEDSDEKEFDTDEEDSNAEDYYGADYPEDEVASDDENDRDVYQYRKHADDLEEFDVEEHETYEIDDDDALVRSDNEGDGRDAELLDARAWRAEYSKTVRGEDMVLQ